MALQNLNPANSTEAKVAKRIPWNSPTSKLGVTEIPGYRLYWFRGDANRIARAQQAGWEFVEQREVKMLETGMGNPLGGEFSADMGSRVSIVSGNGGEAEGQAGRLILMKIKLDWYLEEQQVKEQRNEKVAEAIRGGLLGQEKDKGADAQRRYLDKDRTSIPDLFTPKRQLGAS
jgi:hypothetical protein